MMRLIKCLTPYDPQNCLSPTLNVEVNSDFCLFVLSDFEATCCQGDIGNQ